MSRSPAISHLKNDKVDVAAEMRLLSVTDAANLIVYLMDLLLAKEDVIAALRPICDPFGGAEAFCYEVVGVEMIYALYQELPGYTPASTILYVGRRRDRVVELPVLAVPRLRMAMRMRMAVQ